MKRTTLYGLVAAVAVAGFAAVWFFQPASDIAGDLGAVNAQESADIDTSGVVEMSIGNPDAAVTVIEYASFTCPHCKNFHEGPFKQLTADYIDTGKINFVYREVYFDRYGLWAGMVARCGGPEKYFGIANLIYEQQSQWARGNEAQIGDNLRKLGLSAGLNSDQLDACLSDGDNARAMVAVFQENAAEHEVDSTPSFIINGEKYTNMSYGEFKEILDGLLGQ